jgi:ParB-like chromosome segregation protein Spo0J
LVPSPRNARTHSAAQVAEIAGSIRAFGFTNPVLVGENGDVMPVMVGWLRPVSWAWPKCQ